jgi:lipopolysaccharide transport system ATP-binding protein
VLCALLQEPRTKNQEQRTLNEKQKNYEQRTKNEERRTVSPDVVISVEGLWKQYRYGSISHATLRKDFESWWALVRGKEDPNSRIGQVLSTKNQERKTRNERSEADDRFWALKDVSFDVKQGEILGIIGRNGAGKSTLLKIMSKVTTPTKGRIKIKGRIASLLEVGTGFHPELTGRENIFLNGAILGMTKDEIKRKFDEIVAFAEVEKFIDTPVKRYSSGMYVRLAFAVAAHLEPEILIIDEVLAVGDAQFQKKCLGKMGNVAKEGRTVLFVSHNMGTISRLCTNAFLLDNGKLQAMGNVKETINLYLLSSTSSTAKMNWLPEEAPGDSTCRLLSVMLIQDKGYPTIQIDITKTFAIEIEIEVLQEVRELGVAIKILTADGIIVLHTAHVLKPDGSGSIYIDKGKWNLQCLIPADLLNVGNYSLSVGADTPNIKMHFLKESIIAWKIEAMSSEMGKYNADAWKGIIGPGIATWSANIS